MRQIPPQKHEVKLNFLYVQNNDAEQFGIIEPFYPD